MSILLYVNVYTCRALTIWFHLHPDADRVTAPKSQHLLPCVNAVTSGLRPTGRVITVLAYTLVFKLRRSHAYLQLVARACPCGDVSDPIGGSIPHETNRGLYGSWCSPQWPATNRRQYTSDIFKRESFRWWMRVALRQSHT